MSIQTMISSGVINPCRFLAQTSVDEVVIQASDCYSDFFGVSDNYTYTDGSKVDVIIEELYDVEYGDTVATSGLYLTTDSVGRAIVCSVPGQKYYAKSIYSGTVGAIMKVVKTEGVYQDTYDYRLLSDGNAVVGNILGLDNSRCLAGKPAYGVIVRTEEPSSLGYQAYVATSGIVTAKTGGVFSVGDALVSDSTGRAIKATDFAAAAPAVTYDSSKLTTTAGSTPVTAGAATGAVMSAASGFVALAAPALTGSALPQTIIGYAIQASSGAGLNKKIKLI